MQIGDAVSHYRVTGTLGAGGMGEVFRALDTTLRREVALKVLPREVRQNPDRLARFRREAHLLASLNHPNIGAIYGFEETGEAPFLVLELVEGETLAERLRRGPIPVREAIELARQVADALEAAHERGIVHRDLKPANVKVTESGIVKVLDFGLAKALNADVSSDVPGDASRSPTFAPTGTRLGAIIGTAAYMSPEQARGRPVDRRADVWAFGVLLFEMLTGRRPFGGETITDTIAAIVTADPDWSPLPRDTPPAVRRVLRRALQKDPRLRLPDIGSARIELTEALSGVADPEGAAEVDGAPRRRLSASLAVAAALIAAAAVAAGVFIGRRLAGDLREQTTAHVDLSVPADLRLSPFAAPRVSPDGRHVIVAAQRVEGSTGRAAGPGMLWIRRLDTPAFEPIAGTEGAIRGFWSPDSQSVAFVANGQLKRVAVGSGVQVLCTLDSPFTAGGSWSPDGATIVLSKGLRDSTDPRGATLVLVSASGGAIRPLTTLQESDEGGHYWPEFLPDGRHIAFVVFGVNTENRGVFVAPLDAPDQRTQFLGAAASTVAFSLNHVLFVNGGTLFAQRLEDRVRLAGEPFPLAGPVDVWSPPALGMFSASTNGTLVYTAPAGRNRQLAWVGRDGQTIATVGAPRAFEQLALSPDEQRAAVELPDAAGRHDIWIIDLTRGVLTRLTSDPADDRDPVWSPDGTEVVFRSTRTGPMTLFRKSLVDGQPERRVFEGSGDFVPESWTKNGDSLLYVQLDALNRIGWRRSTDAGTADAIVTGESVIDELQVSPDGRFVAYASTESGRFEVYVRPLGRPGAKVRVSLDGGGQPKWRGDGRELFYVTDQGMLMAVPVRYSGASIVVGLPVPLFELADNDAELDHYAPSSDGQRFLVRLPARPAGNAAVHVVLNWDRRPDD
ncbi:MAG TPA: protein kinase [Vicinamibacterales bacterium]|nr:protein kinase [Vicinamibacterales bacterium]